MSHATVPRILAQAKLQPHRLDCYMASKDPNFETKAADIIGLYLNPPQHTVSSACTRNGDSGAGQTVSRFCHFAGGAERHVLNITARRVVPVCDVGREDRKSREQNQAEAYQR